jgi:hypothetical protein
MEGVFTVIYSPWVGLLLLLIFFLTEISISKPSLCDIVEGTLAANLADFQEENSMVPHGMLYSVGHGGSVGTLCLQVEMGFNSYFINKAIEFSLPPPRPKIK